MLTDLPAKTSERRLALQLPPSAWRAVLTALLEEWGYRLLPAPTSEDLLLIEAGTIPPPVHGPLLWLAPDGCGGPDRLPFPLTPEELWSALEKRFHSPPRSHIRINLQLPTTIYCRQRTSETRLVNLSDLGCRFFHHQELAKGEEVVLFLAREGLTLAGQVIYAMERRDIDGTDVKEIGLLFDRPSSQVRERLRELIIGTCLERVRARLPASVYRQGLAIFRLPPGFAEAAPALGLPRAAP